MAEFIDREGIRCALIFNDAITDKGLEILLSYPSVNMIPREEYEQVEHQRNAARFQLNLIGKNIGANMDDVRVMRKGKWIKRPLKHAWMCSYCYGLAKVNSCWCPNCGAKMESEEKDG